jgi:hypothetical protein
VVELMMATAAIVGPMALMVQILSIQRMGSGDPWRPHHGLVHYTNNYVCHTVALMGVIIILLKTLIFG